VPELLRETAALAAAQGWPVTIHVAESAEEDEMFAGGRGALYDWLARNGRDMGDCGGTTPVQHLAKHGLLFPGLLAVHANYLRPGDAETLAGAGGAVVHCPRSHAYFGHRPFPHNALVRAGVNVCLGTDSLVTVLRREEQVLDMFSEMRTFLAHAAGVPAEEAVRMATVHGARALGLEGRAGCLMPGAWADATAVPYAGGLGTVAEAVVAHRGDVAACLLGGRWAHGPVGTGEGEAAAAG
jgi:cytosine/adenosine deaminase-related metal-dependent hydrolase